MKEKYIIFDSSTLISFAMNGLLEELKKLKEIFGGRFLIPEEVKRESIEKPLESKRFELEALRLNALLEEKILELPSSIGLKKERINSEGKRILDMANNTFFENGKKEIHVIDSGEAECIALGKILSSEGKENVIAIDERTTRILFEKPENLKKILQKKLHVKIEMKKENMKEFSNVKMIRSAELIFLAYKKGIVKIRGKKSLDALLYAMKFKGCAISNKEIDELKKMV